MNGAIQSFFQDELIFEKINYLKNPIYHNQRSQIKKMLKFLEFMIEIEGEVMG